MKISHFLPLTCLFVHSLSAQVNYWHYQTPYDLSFKKELIIGGISLFSGITGYIVEKNEALPSFEAGSFTQKEIHDINFIDRAFAGRWDLKAGTASNNIKNLAKQGVQIALIFFPGNIKNRGSLFIVYLEGYILTNGLTSFVKGITERYRPYTYMSLDQINNLESRAKEKFLLNISKDGREDSFFSGHASSAAYGFTFFAKVFSDYFPDSKWKYGIWGLSLAGITTEAFFRVKSGNHFPTDVIAGSVIGGAIGYFIPYFHQKNKSQKVSLNTGFNRISLVYKL